MSYIARHRKAIAASGATTAIATGLLVVAGTGTAFAYFSGGFGTGTGAATTQAAQTVTASLVGSTSGTLYPGGTADVTVSITNPYNNRVLTLTGVTAGTGSIGVTGASGSCSSATADVSVNASGATLLPTTVAGGATTQITITGAVKMGTNSASGCQSATFNVPLAVTMKVG